MGNKIRINLFDWIRNVGITTIALSPIVYLITPILPFESGIFWGFLAGCWMTIFILFLIKRNGVKFTNE
jgi:hypothetical protein